MERWGLVLRRAENGNPHLTTGLGHSTARIATTGDTTGREIHSILEEQCMKRSILRRGDTQALKLVTEGGMVSGLITLDVQHGEMVAIKTKAVILATDGLESAWNGGSGGTGLWLAANAGISLSNMEFVSWNPLCMEMYGLELPFAILNDGASVRSASGSNIEFASEGGLTQASQTILAAGERCVLDARVLSRGAPVWYADTSERVSSRLGSVMDESVIPIVPQVSTTLGGIPCDMTGAVSELAGLFAAGDNACSGFHGADIAVGNRMLESLDGGSSAGAAAAEFASNADYSNTDAMDISLSESASKFANLLAGDDSGITRGQMANQLNTIMSEAMGITRTSTNLSSAVERLAQLASTPITLSDESSLMNTELVEVFRLEGMVTAATSAVTAAASRDESCGSHQRTDE
jgi:succinate dehydrogenase/fumarate reductase flavoprotein subunit